MIIRLLVIIFLVIKMVRNDKSTAKSICYHCRTRTGDVCMNTHFETDQRFQQKCTRTKACTTAFIYAVGADYNEYGVQRYCSEEINCPLIKQYMRHEYPGTKIYCYELTCGTPLCNGEVYSTEETKRYAKQDKDAKAEHHDPSIIILFLSLFICYNVPLY